LDTEKAELFFLRAFLELGQKYQAARFENCPRLVGHTRQDFDKKDYSIILSILPVFKIWRLHSITFDYDD